MRFFIITLVLLSMAAAYAQDTTSKTSAKLSTVLPALVKTGLGLSLDLSRSSNLFDESEAEASISNSLSITTSYTFSNSSALSINAAVTEDESGNGDTTFSDTTLTYGLASTQLSRDNSIKLSASATIPTSESSITDNGLRGAGSGRISLTKKKQLFSKPLTITSFLDALKYSHKFELNTDRKENMSHRGRLFGSLSLSATDKLSLSLSGYYQVGETYKGTRKVAFMTSQKISYAVSDKLSIYGSHTNDGNALGPNGEDSNIEAFGSTTSKLGAGISATF